MAPHKPEGEEGRKAQSTSWAAVNYLMRNGWSWSGQEQNCSFFNLQGSGFADLSYVSGLGYIDDARGVIATDWDGDGDLDLWLNNRSSPRLRFMRNDYHGPNRWVSFRLVATNGNRDAVGARVEIHQGDRKLMKTLRAGVNYQAQPSKILHFGLGPEDAIDKVVVRWSDGTVSTYNDVAPGKRYLITQGESGPAALPAMARQKEFAVKTLEVPAWSQTASVPLGTALPLPPSLGLTDFDGNRFDLGSLAGKPVLINLWATWCNPCVVELGEWVEHRDTMAASGGQVLACSVDKPEDRQKAIDMARTMGFWFPAGAADEQLLTFLEVSKKVLLDNYQDLPLPSSLLIDGRGNLRRIYRGPASPEQIARDIREMNKAVSQQDVLMQASMYGGGRWFFAEDSAINQRDVRAMRMVEFATNEGAYELAGFYSTTLGTGLANKERTEHFTNKALALMLSSGRRLLNINPALAEQVYREVLKTESDNLDALSGLASALASVGSPAARVEARAIFDRIMPRMPEPDSPEKWAAYGNILHSVGDAEKAIPYLRKAAELQPQDATVKMRLGLALVDANQTAEGLSVLTAAVEQLPPDPRHQVTLARALDIAGRTSDAEAAYKRAIELVPNPTTVEECTLVGRALFRLQQWEEAAGHLNRVASADPSDAAVRSQLGLALAYLGRDDLAIDHLQFALPRLPDNAEDEFVLGTLLARKGRFGDAITSFAKVVSLNPQHNPGAKSLAMAYERAGQLDKAIAAYQSYTSGWPQDLQMHQRLAGVFEQAGKPDQAVATYRQVLLQNPRDQKSKYRLAWLLATADMQSVRDGDTAIRMADDLLAEVGDTQPLAYDLKAAAHAELGEFDKAIEAVNKAIEIARSQPGSADMLKDFEARLALYKASKPYRFKP